MTIRNAIVPVASFGSDAGVWMIFIGLVFQPLQFLAYVGIALFAWPCSFSS